jgi:hypothetical protein
MISLPYHTAFFGERIRGKAAWPRHMDFDLEPSRQNNSKPKRGTSSITFSFTKSFQFSKRLSSTGPEKDCTDYIDLGGKRGNPSVGNGWKRKPFRGSVPHLRGLSKPRGVDQHRKGPMGHSGVEIKKLFSFLTCAYLLL